MQQQLAENIRCAAASADIPALRALYATESLLIGRELSNGELSTTVEYIVMHAVIHALNTPGEEPSDADYLQLLTVFFRELGGRTISFSEEGLTIFSVLTFVDGLAYSYRQRVETRQRWYSVMAMVTKHLVEILGTPVQTLGRARVSQWKPMHATIFEAAADINAWAALMAMIPYIQPPWNALRVFSETASDWTEEEQCVLEALLPKETDDRLRVLQWTLKNTHVVDGIQAEEKRRHAFVYSSKEIISQ